MPVYGCGGRDRYYAQLIITQPLYHYTSLETFLKIAESKSIRLSDLSQSNDALEGRYIATQISDAIEQSEIPQRYIHTVQRMVSEVATYERRFGFCLTTQDDDLSQWRGYGDDGFGVCIGFDREKVFAAVKSTNETTANAILRRVHYGPEALSDTVETLVSELEAELSSFDPEAINAAFRQSQNLGVGPAISLGENLEFDEAMAMKLVVELLKGPVASAFNYKSSAFEAENEWRILVGGEPHRDPSEAKYTSMRNRISAYVEADVSCSIVEVTIGPKSDVTVKDMERVLYGLEMRNILGEGPTVKKSAASYR